MNLSTRIGTALLPVALALSPVTAQNAPEEESVPSYAPVASERHRLLEAIVAEAKDNHFGIVSLEVVQ